MGLWRGGLFLLVLLGTVVDGQAGTVLTIITPGPQSHLFGMKKITLEMAARGHKVAVRSHESLFFRRLRMHSNTPQSPSFS